MTSLLKTGIAHFFLSRVAIRIHSDLSHFAGSQSEIFSVDPGPHSTYYREIFEGTPCAYAYCKRYSTPSRYSCTFRYTYTYEVHLHPEEVRGTVTHRVSATPTRYNYTYTVQPHLNTHKVHLQNLRWTATPPWNSLQIWLNEKSAAQHQRKRSNEKTYLSFWTACWIGLITITSQFENKYNLAWSDLVVKITDPRDKARIQPYPYPNHCFPRWL